MPNVSVVLDTDDRVASLAAGANPLNVPGTLKRAEPYACKHTILIGKATGKYVAANFNINYDLLDKIFDVAGYGDTGGLNITETMCQLYRYKSKTVTAPRDTRSKDATFVIEKRGRNSRAFMGQRITFKIATSLANDLYPAPFARAGATRARKSASMLFPNVATLPQIACWMSLNMGTVNRSKIGKIVTARGTAVLLSGIAVNGIADTATLDKQIGAFKVATANKLQGVSVVEFQP